MTDVLLFISHWSEKKFALQCVLIFHNVKTLHTRIKQTSREKVAPPIAKSKKKTCFCHMRTENNRISLRICTV